MATLYCVGTPLQDTQALDPQSKALLETADLIIGESKKTTFRYLTQLSKRPADDALFFLDPFRKDEWERLVTTLERNKKANAAVCLISDTGMPILFDPGIEVLELCRKLGYDVHSSIGATSWGMAAALSGFPPPFFVEGFLPRDNAERLSRLGQLKREKGLILMDTPYRFQLLLKQCAEAFGKREAFLAWELTGKEERLRWGTLGELEKMAQREKLEKGEFVLVIR
jgi:16S rRNA (cytidine1402-2'-O)-methyltransferase